MGSIPEAQDQSPLTPFAMSVFKSTLCEYRSKSSSSKERGNAGDWSSRTHSAVMQDLGVAYVTAYVGHGSGSRRKRGRWRRGEEIAWERHCRTKG